MNDVVIIGSGPSGLSCAVEAVRAGLSCTVLERGGIAEAIRRFPTDLVWFSTPELLEVGEVPFIISTTRPTRGDTLNYYQKVAATFRLNIRTHNGVSSIRRQEEFFRVMTEKGLHYDAKNVVIATGYFDHPNRLGVPGEDCPNVLHYYEEPYAYCGCNVIVVGGRNSAVEAALDLYRHGAHVTLVHQGERLSEGVKYWILPDIENRMKAGQVRGQFRSHVVEFSEREVRVSTPDGVLSLDADFTFVLIGFRPDTKWLEECGVDVDEMTLSPRMNPVTFETNVSGLFVAGSVVAGKDNNKVFVENGRLHAFSIVPAIRKRLSAA